MQGPPFFNLNSVLEASGVFEVLNNIDQAYVDIIMCTDDIFFTNAHINF